MARVLLVDDDPDIRATTSWRLRLDGHEVVEVSDLEAATAAGPGCQVAVVDLHHPGHDNDRACMALRSYPGTRGLPVIAGQPVSRLLAAIERLSREGANLTAAAV
jgi:CheY-like chemotaxis protein